LVYEFSGRLALGDSFKGPLSVRNYPISFSQAGGSAEALIESLLIYRKLNPDVVISSGSKLSTKIFKDRKNKWRSSKRTRNVVVERLLSNMRGAGTGRLLPLMEFWRMAVVANNGPIKKAASYTADISVLLANYCSQPVPDN
jgi:hypothetical protein